MDISPYLLRDLPESVFLNGLSYGKKYWVKNPQVSFAPTMMTAIVLHAGRREIRKIPSRLLTRASMIDCKYGTQLLLPALQTVDVSHRALRVAKQVAKPLTSLKKFIKLDELSLFYNLWEVSQTDGEKDYVKPFVCYGASKVTGLVVASIFGAATGGIGILAAFCVSVVADLAVSFIYDRAKESLTAAKQSSSLGPEMPGSAGMRRPGGVEFRIAITFASQEHIHPEIVVSRLNNVFFQTDIETEVLLTFRSLCAPRFQRESLHTYFQTIVSEVQAGLQHTRQLPFVSLHFNENALLYSVMHPFYRHTLLGSVLTYLDYFLKGFVNGGFFPVSFVREWEQTRTTDIDILNKHLHIIKKILPASCKSYYRSYSQLLPRDQSEPNVYSSAFRIIGRMKTEWWSTTLHSSLSLFSQLRQTSTLLRPSRHSSMDM